ncbi:HpcH/HpaI aldolase/citrate lyase family protein [Nesterenkonia alkaliphila]|uniref:CoA ester lyase n=1 Tax=Nesterenkonia alkaliphila TaxID=1463631 RepID=A0A7K1UED8_9MICC|nr:CoA ester lyase [Nesterenkonia alkaliphila]MVT24828.1 CoA ester lyase [Nesterenkonia alkaliphila]GFZ93622.1 CoA ester lyase [Nesterenkonia alkaliphila]
MSTAQPASAPEPFLLGPAMLFCPADRPERYAKAAERSDAVILDLEDAVAPADKPAGRAALIEHLDSAAQDLLERTVVRVNPAGTDAFAADMQALAGAAPQWIMLAKTESADDVQAVTERIPKVPVIALVETAAGAAAVQAIAEHPATAAIMWGAEDLIASLGGTSSRGPDGSYREIARYVRSTVLLAAASRGKAAIDAIYADIKDAQGLAEEAADAVGSGFAAKACIHPAQVQTIREAYRPTEEELEHARALLEEVSKHGGVFQFRGAMVDGPLIRHAELIVSRATV